MKGAVFLDRDGVVNPLVYNQAAGEYESPHVPDDFSIYPWVLKSLRLLKNHGFYVFIVSNQPSYAKGKTSLENIQAIEKLLRDYIDDNNCLIDEYYYCYHHPNGIIPEYSVFCPCRKPGIMFLEQAASAFSLDLSASFFIGDQDTDIKCGKNAGTKTVKIINKHSIKKSGQEVSDAFASNLYEAVEKIILFQKKET